MRRLSSAVACGICLALPAQAQSTQAPSAQAQSPQDLSTQNLSTQNLSSQNRQDAQTDAMRLLLKNLQTLIADQTMAEFSAIDLVQKAGLATYATPAKPALTFIQPATAKATPVPVEGQSLDLRLAVTMLSQSYGPDGTFNVLAAQTNPNLKALVLRKGTANLADIRRLLQENQLQTVAPDGVLRLDVPLVVWSGAGLVLGPNDKVELNRSTGAFLINFGHLDLNGASISGAGAANPASPSFMPFVTTADGGSVAVKNGHFLHLGFGVAPAFSGFSVMRSIVHTADRQNHVEASRFEDLVSFTIDGASDVVVDGNRFTDMRGGSIVVTHSTNATIRSNLFSGKMPTNAIRLADASLGAVIEGNVVLGGKHAGILIGKDSGSAVISNNIIWKRAGGGISVSNSDCEKITGNLVIDNTQKGIEVRDSLDARVEQNTILSNHSAGIWVSGQRKGAQTWLAGNTLAANGSGLAGAIGESIYLDANDFTRQFPQFLSGDLTAQFRSVALDLRGTKPIVLLASDNIKNDPPKTTCSN